MNFLNPAILFGLLAASIPLILHLLNLRKQKKVEFSSLRFLKELQKSKIRRIKIKQILLLILRTLLIIFIVMAFARPVVESSLPYFTSYSKTSAVIIIDNSYSLAASDEFGNRFRQSKNVALSILSELKEGDEASVITTSNNQDNYSNSLTGDFDFLKDNISKIEISTEENNLKYAVTQANDLLKNTINLNKDVYIITDGQKNILNKMSDSVKIIDEKLGVLIAKVGRNSSFNIDNISIDSLRVISQIYTQNKVVEFEVGIKNNTNNDISGLIVSLSYDGERAAQKSLDIKSGKLGFINISAPVKETGIISGMVSIETDAIDEDNQRYFGFIVPEAPKICLIQEKKDIFLDVLFNKVSESNIEIDKFSVSESGKINLSLYDNLYLVNGKYSTTLLNRLELFVKEGGNLFVFANDERNEEFDNFMKKMNLNLGSFVDIGEGSPINFSSMDKFHPIFDGVFKGVTDGKMMVESPNIYKLLPAVGGRVIINTPSGAFLTESRLGEGKVLYCGVASDLSWGNFPLTGIYPSLIHKSISYLSSGSETSVFAKSGEKVVINVPNKKSGNKKFKIIDPNEKVFFQQSVKLASGNNLYFENLSETGVYKIYNSNDLGVSSVAINHFKEESEQIYLSDEALKESFENQFVNEPAVELLEDLENIDTEIIRAKLGTELWKIFIVLALLTALIEMLVQRISKNEIQE